MKHKVSFAVYWFFAVSPLLLSAAFYSRLPERVATHWDLAGNVNGYSSRPMAAFGVPAILLGATLLVNFMFSIDPKRQNINRSPQIKAVVCWSIVALSNLMQAIVLLNALHAGAVNVATLTTVFIGIMLAAIGNYLPKCKPNYTLGIRLPWTLASEENWRKTHRFAGPLWIVGGALMVLSAFSPFRWMLFVLLVLLCIVPAVYSYRTFQKEEAAKNGKDGETK